MADRTRRVHFIRETNEGAQRNGPNKDWSKCFRLSSFLLVISNLAVKYLFINCDGKISAAEPF